MNIIFYLVLAAIAILGIFALVLIFWGRIKFPQRKPKVITENQSKIAKENDIDAKWQDDVKPVHKASVNIDDRIVPILDDVNFGELDDLLSSTTMPEVITISPKPTKTTARSNALMILYVLADAEHPFVGYELLQSLLSVGLRYGEMNIFHYHQQMQQGQGPTLFSLASAVEPGIFDLANVGAISCPGLSLFMSMQNDNPVKNFELMFETAQQLAEDLGGVLCDAQHMPLTEARLAEYRAKIFEESF